MLNLILLFMLSLGTSQAPHATLSVEITNVQASDGTLRVALYKPGTDFGKRAPDFYKNVPVGQPGSIRLSFDVLPGRYAIAVYHDQNDNNKLDKNLVGYPKEPFGFSNNYRPLISAPEFQDCAFELAEEGTSVSIKLID